jgi:transcriptional regulator with XRE-family HTH domain
METKTKDEMLDYLYETLEKVRSENKLTKKEFAEKAGFSQNWYQQALKQKRDISYTDVSRMAAHYKINLQIF